jgi:hypothetical protein
MLDQYIQTGKLEVAESRSTSVKTSGRFMLTLMTSLESDFADDQGKG